MTATAAAAAAGGTQTQQPVSSVSQFVKCCVHTSFDIDELWPLKLARHCLVSGPWRAGPGRPDSTRPDHPVPTISNRRTWNATNVLRMKPS